MPTPLRLSTRSSIALAAAASIAMALAVTAATPPATLSGDAPMIESYDLHGKNPFGDKLSVLPLATGTAAKTISLSIPAGQELPEHTTPIPAALFMLEGEARFVTATQDIPLRPGTVVHIPPAVPHRVVAAQNSLLLLVK